MLARLAELDATDLAVAGAVTRSMGLTGPEGHRLRHGLVGAALGVVQSSHQRRDLHLRAARMLRDAGAPSDRIAAHLLTVGGAAPAWTVEARRDAAGTAVRRGESWTAVRYLRHALLAGPDEPGRAAVLLDLAGLERSRDTGLALRRIVQAVPLLGSLRERAAALCRVTPLALEGAAPPVIALLRGVAEELGRYGGTGDTETRELALRVEARLHYVDKHTRAGLSAAAAGSTNSRHSRTGYRSGPRGSGSSPASCCTPPPSADTGRRAWWPPPAGRSWPVSRRRRTTSTARSGCW
jgi:hypothetical protein